MSTINCINSVDVNCFNTAAPDMRVPATLSTDAMQGLLYDKVDGIDTCIIAKAAKFALTFKDKIFRSGFSGLQIRNDTQQNEISNATYVTEKNQLTFSAGTVPLNNKYQTEEGTFIPKFDILIKDGLSDIIKIDFDLFILSIFIKSKVIVESIFNKEIDNIIPSNVQSPSPSEASPKQSSSDSQIVDLPYASAIDVVFSKKSSNEKIETKLIAKQTNNGIICGNNKSLFSKEITFQLQIKNAFSFISSVFVKKEDELIYLSGYKFFMKTGELNFRFDAIKLPNPINTNEEARIKRMKKGCFTLYIHGKNAQNQDELIRSDGIFYLISTFRGKYSIPMCKKILAENEDTIEGTNMVSLWPEVIPSEMMPKIAHSQISSQGNLNSQQLKIQASVGIATEKLQKDVRRFNKEGQETVATVATAFVKALTQMGSSNVEETAAALFSIAQISQTFVKNVTDTTTLPLVRERGEGGSETESEEGDGTGSAERRSKIQKIDHQSTQKQ